MIKLNQRTPIIDKGEYGYNFLEVSLTYDKGGWNMMTGKEEQRGFTVIVMPIRVGEGFRGFRAYDGTMQFVEVAKRYSEKRHIALFHELLDGGQDGLLDVLKKYVMAKKDFTYAG